MNKVLKIIFIMVWVSLVSSCQLLGDKQKTDISPWPDVVGIPPGKNIKNWVKFELVGTMNHPFPFVWFSPQQFEREYPNALIKLSDGEYEQFKLFVRNNECENNLDQVKGDPLLAVTEYADGHESVRCIMPPQKACEYMTKIYNLPLIAWAAAQTEELRLLGNDLRCEFVGKKFQAIKN